MSPVLPGSVPTTALVDSPLIRSPSLPKKAESASPKVAFEDAEDRKADEAETSTPHNGTAILKPECGPLVVAAAAAQDLSEAKAAGEALPRGTAGGSSRRRKFLENPRKGTHEMERRSRKRPRCDEEKAAPPPHPEKAVSAEPTVQNPVQSASHQDRLHVRDVLLLPSGRARNLLREFAGDEEGCGTDESKFELEFHSGKDIPNSLFESLLAVTKINMSALYDSAEGWKWSDKAKRKELLNDSMRFIVARERCDDDHHGGRQGGYNGEATSSSTASSAVAAVGSPPGPRTAVHFRIESGRARLMRPLHLRDGATVQVAPRMGPGSNRPGGIGRITAHDAESNTYDVKYVLGGRETHVPAAYLSPACDLAAVPRGDASDPPPLLFSGSSCGERALPQSSPPEAAEAPERPNRRGRVVGFCAFRLAHELGVLHLYVHELQLLKRARRVGLGKRMMRTCETIATKSGMKIVMLTVHTSNAAAVKFYRCLGYAIDEASPGPCYCVDDSSYEIMSKVMHESVLRYPCSFGGCGKAYRYPDSLRQHCSVAHGEAFLYPCPIPGCGRGVVQTWQLKRHCWTHSAPKDSNGRCNYGAQLSGGEGMVGDRASPNAPVLRSNSVQGFWLFSRVVIKGDGRMGTVTKCAHGFYTVRLDGSPAEELVCRRLQLEFATKTVKVPPSGDSSDQCDTLGLDDCAGAMEQAPEADEATVAMATAPPPPKKEVHPDFIFAMELQRQESRRSRRTSAR